MRKLTLFAIAALIAGMAATACENRNTTPDPDPDPMPNEELSVDRPSITFEGNTTDEVEVEVTSELAWTTSISEGDDEWISIEPWMDETGFTVSVTNYDGDAAREGTITVSNGKNEATVTVNQGIVAVYEFVDARARYLDHDRTGLDDTDVDNKGLPYLQFWGSKVNGAFEPEVPCWNLTLQTIIHEPDLTGTVLELEEGTYNWALGGDLPAIFGADQPNCYVLWVGAGGDYIDVVEGSSMTVEKTADGYSITFNLKLSDGTFFKARYNGAVKMDNPWNTGLSEDMDLGVISGEGTGRMGTMAAIGYYSIVPDWTLRVCSPGLTRDAETNTFTGSGYFMKMETRMGGAGWIMPDGTYDVKPRPGASDLTNYCVIMGDESDIANNCGTWIYRYEDGVIMDKARVMSGSIKITCNTPANTDTSASQNIPTSYTFEVDVEESLGFSVKGTFTATCDWIDVGTISNI